MNNNNIGPLQVDHAKMEIVMLTAYVIVRTYTDYGLPAKVSYTVKNARLKI